MAFPYENRRLLFKSLMPQAHQRLQDMRKVDTDRGRSLKPFEQHQCIFVHITKCAGVSMLMGLFGNRGGGHMRISHYQLAFSRSEFENYFKFTFVRNPWDRLVSAYLFLKEGGHNKVDKAWMEQNIASYDDFNSFVAGWVNRSNVHTWKHFVPQYRFVCEPGHRTPRVDFVGFFENLEEDFLSVQKRLGLDSGLGHLNQTKGRKRRDYREYYTETTKEIVAHVYREDIQLFGYDFDNTSLEQQLARRRTLLP